MSSLFDLSFLPKITPPNGRERLDERKKDKEKEREEKRNERNYRRDVF
jgi:hypothetical protein